MRTVAILFARADSIYKTMHGCDVWDKDRNALNWPGGAPCVAHPPCRAWGSLRGLANPEPGERELAIWAVEQVRRNGGVLEHPRRSLLWPECDLPKPGERDAFGGWSMCVPQFWWGHRAEKLTMLYIVGIEPSQIPAIPLQLGHAPKVICSMKRVRDGGRPWVTKAEREQTPPAFAKWLVQLARMCRVPQPVAA